MSGLVSVLGMSVHVAVLSGCVLCARGHVSVLSESGRMTGSLRRHGHALDVGGAGEIRSAQARRRGADAPRRERARG